MCVRNAETSRSPTRAWAVPRTSMGRPAFDASPQPREAEQVATKTRDRGLKHTSTFGRLARSAAPDSDQN